jgi:hypothetical protein
MVKKIYRLQMLLIALLYTLFFSCVTPQPIIQLYPLAESTRFYQGAEYIESSANKITAAVSFSAYRESMLIFDVEIINNSKKSMLIEPVSFYYFPLDVDPRGLDPKQNDNLYGGITAIDPEQMILNIRNNISKEKADYANYQTVDAVSGVLGIIGSFAASNAKEQEEMDQMREEDEDDSRDRELEHNQRINSLNQQIDFWEKYSIRKTTLDPGKSAAYVELHIPAGKDEFKFLFSQQIIRPGY